MRGFAQTVLAYLTGWLIVQPTYNRLLKYWRRRELENPSEETQAYWHEQACAIVDVMEARGHLPSHDPEDDLETY